MTTKTKYLIPLCLLACIAAAVALFSGISRSSEQQQLEYITNFYENHLSRPWNARSNILPIGVFYSKEADELITRNARLCLKLARSDEICGYGANTDIFLNAQEIDPALSFETSRFKAVASGRNMVDISFNVYPKLGDFYNRSIRYVFKKEAGGWRVDDVLFADETGFSPAHSMRYWIKQENDVRLAEAADLSGIVRWVFSFLSDTDMMTRAERFMTDPVEICGTNGRCELVAKDAGDGKLRAAIEALHQGYYDGDPQKFIDTEAFLPKNTPASDRKPVRVDAFDFIFTDDAWWIRKIDLRRLTAHPAASRKT